MISLTTKAEILAVIAREQRFWDALCAEVGEVRMTEPGVNGVWSFKDLAAHLNAWRQYTVARLVAAREDAPLPLPPWPAAFQSNDYDGINAWFYERDHDRSLADVLAETQLQFRQMRETVEWLSEEALIDPHRFAWMNGHPLSAIIGSAIGHLHVEHEPDIRAWLTNRDAATE